MMSEEHRGLPRSRQHTRQALTNTRINIKRLPMFILYISTTEPVSTTSSLKSFDSPQTSQRHKWLAACLSCMTMTVIIGCRTPWQTLPLLSAVPMQHLQSATKCESSLTFFFASIILLHIFFFPPLCRSTWYAKIICLLSRSKFLPPFPPSCPPPPSSPPRLKMDSFHYASQQRAAPAHAAHSKHTDKLACIISLMI